MEPSHLDSAILALLFASDEPLSVRKACSIFDDVGPDEVRASLERLTEALKSMGPSIVLESVAGGWQLSTNPEFAEYVARLYSGRRKQRLSKAGLETLAIIAYKQPITRADIEHVRGVSCGGVITTLMERNLIRIVGKAKVLGSPFLYGTTQEFLEYLGINALKDLPSLEELEALLEQEENRASDGAPAPPPAEPGARVEDFGFPSDSAQPEGAEDHHAWESEISSTDGPETRETSGEDSGEGSAEGSDAIEADR